MISRGPISRDIAQDAINRNAQSVTQEKYAVWTGLLPDGRRSPGFELDLKENLVAYCIRQSVLERYGLQQFMATRVAKTQPDAQPLKTIVGHGETLEDILVQELCRVYIAVGRSRNVKDKPRPEDYWVALDYNERGIFYGHLVPRTDQYDEGKYSVPVGQNPSSKNAIPSQVIHNGDRGGDPQGTFSMTPERQMQSLRASIDDVKGGQKLFGEGRGVPSETATVLTSNDPASTTGIRVEVGAVHADEAGKDSEYDPAKVDKPDRFGEACPPGG
jgi:hypothetical protein